jgi:predicted patatin/cPLA2 family phospholipase
MPEKYDVFDTATFDANPMEYYVVCTDVETGEAVYSRQMQSGYDCYEWIRASASMPLVSRIVEINGQKLLDGGIADSIPLHFFESVGYDRNVVILTQPRGYMKEHNKFMPLLRLNLRKYPKMLNALDRRHEMYNAQTRYVEEREKTGDVFVIRPDEPLHIGHVEHNPDRMRAVYNEGRKVGERRIGEILSFLKAI